MVMRLGMEEKKNISEENKDRKKEEHQE